MNISKRNKHAECQCHECRAARVGLGPGPYTPEEFMRFAGEAVHPADPVSPHVAEAMAAYDEPIAKAEADVDSALNSYSLAEMAMSNTHRELLRHRDDFNPFDGDGGLIVPPPDVVGAVDDLHARQKDAQILLDKVDEHATKSSSPQGPTTSKGTV
jgi:hypothetical protein